MKKIVFVMIVAFEMAFGAGSVDSESKATLPQKAEYKIVQIVIDGSAIQAPKGAIFGIDGAKIYGNTGCNSYFTDFSRVDSENIEVSTNGGATKMMCDRESMDFERVFLQNLVGVFSVIESSNDLNLKGKKMDILLKK